MKKKETAYDIEGVHGYNPAYPSMKPIFFARGPAFKTGNYQARDQFLTKDLYAIIAHVTGITPRSSTNATLENAWDIFASPSSSSSSSKHSGAQFILLLPLIKNLFNQLF